MLVANISPKNFTCRNHLVDFLVHRSKLFQSGAGGERPKHPPVVQPGLDVERAPVTVVPLDNPRHS